MVSELTEAGIRRAGYSVIHRVGIYIVTTRARKPKPQCISKEIRKEALRAGLDFERKKRHQGCVRRGSLQTAWPAAVHVPRKKAPCSRIRPPSVQ